MQTYDERRIIDQRFCFVDALFGARGHPNTSRRLNLPLSSGRVRGRGEGEGGVPCCKFDRVAVIFVVLGVAHLSIGVPS